MNVFSQRLKDIRIDNSLSQRDLAKELGVSQASIARWENGLQTPNIEYLKAIAILFKVTTDYLLGLED